MESSIPTQERESPDEHTLLVDFSWHKFTTLITKKSDPKSNQLYLVGCKVLKSNLEFKTASDSQVFGTGHLPTVSIDTDCTVRSHAIQLKALKRLKTSYTHLSYAYSDTEIPVPMTWTSTSNFKTWDFVCLDENMEPVARFKTNIWALKRIGEIEFMGPKCGEESTREEILVVGITLFYTMLVRSSSLLSLIGAAVAKPGPIQHPEHFSDPIHSAKPDDRLATR